MDEWMVERQLHYSVEEPEVADTKTEITNLSNNKSNKKKITARLEGHVR